MSSIISLADIPLFCTPVAIYRFSLVMNTTFVTLLFCSGLPILVPIAGATFALTYFIDKAMILKFYRRPPRYDASLVRTFVASLPWALVLHLVFAIVVYGASEVFASDTIGVDELESYLEVMQSTVASEPSVAPALTAHANLTEGGHLEILRWAQASVSRRVTQRNVFPSFVLLLLVVLYLTYINLLEPVLYPFITPILIIVVRIGRMCGRAFCCCFRCCCDGHRLTSPAVLPFNDSTIDETARRSIEDIERVAALRKTSKERRITDRSATRYQDLHQKQQPQSWYPPFTGYFRRALDAPAGAAVGKVDTADATQGWCVEGVEEGNHAGDDGRVRWRTKAWLEDGRVGGVQHHRGDLKRTWEVIRDDSVPLYDAELVDKYVYTYGGTAVH